MGFKWIGNASFVVVGAGDRATPLTDAPMPRGVQPRELMAIWHARRAS